MLLFSCGRCGRCSPTPRDAPRQSHRLEVNPCSLRTCSPPRENARLLPVLPHRTLSLYRQVGVVIGRRASTIKGLQKRTGCRIQIRPQKGPGTDRPTRRITLTGVRGSLHDAKREIEVMLQRAYNIEQVGIFVWLFIHPIVGVFRFLRCCRSVDRVILKIGPAYLYMQRQTSLEPHLFFVPAFPRRPLPHHLLHEAAPQGKPDAAPTVPLASVLEAAVRFVIFQIVQLSRSLRQSLHYTLCTLE